MVGRRVRLSGPAFRPLTAEKTPPATPADSVDVLQRFLVDRLASAEVDGVVSRALDAIQRSHGCFHVADIAAECGVSPRHLNRLMRTWVGYGPKVFGRVVRFQETLEQIRHAPGQSGAALAADAGYFDQSHLAWEMTRLAGATPGHVAAQCVADFYKTRCDGPL
jgi:methylphosphotriester-DNA--protein-cysteine methyltransferase